MPLLIIDCFLGMGICLILNTIQSAPIGQSQQWLEVHIAWIGRKISVCIYSVLFIEHATNKPMGGNTSTKYNTNARFLCINTSAPLNQYNFAVFSGEYISIAVLYVMIWLKSY